MSKKVVAILVNDIHLNKDNGELIKSIFKQLVDICKDCKTNNIFCGGDVFTNRSGQPLSCLTDWKDILQMLNKKKIFLHVIPGNHDKTDKDSNRSYLDIFSEPCLCVYDIITNSMFDNLEVVFAPYFGEERWLSDYKEFEKENKIKSPSILITHMGFEGVVNNDGSSVVSNIKPSMFKKYTSVLIGHYHNASKIAKNVFYTGSAYQNNYGETIDDKGCTIIYDDGTTSHKSLIFPKFIKEVVDVNDKETLRNLLDKYEGENYNHVRFVFKGKKVDANKVDLSELSRRGIDAQFQAVETEDAIITSESEAVMTYDKKEILKDFMKFCSENSIKGKYLKYGMNLIRDI